MNKRDFLKLSGAFTGAVAGVASGTAFLASSTRNADAMNTHFPPMADGMAYEITRSEDQWREFLSDDQFKILRKHKTERPFTSPLNDEKRAGTFNCAGCDLPVYASNTKYDSGTGWPSFWDNIDDAVRTKEDNTLFMKRIEVHCRRCGGHFGHIFKDGPQPTGLRHCINGVALTFKAEAA